MLVNVEKVLSHVPIFITNIENQKIIDSAIKAIYDLQKQNPTSIDSYVYADYVSPWNSHKLHDGFKSISELLISFCKEISKTYYKVDCEFYIYNMWGILYNSGSMAQRHNHYPSLWSCSVYLDIDKFGSPLVFENYNTLNLKKGDIVVFPGFLNHEVNPTLGKRIVISANIDRV